MQAIGRQSHVSMDLLKATIRGDVYTVKRIVRRQRGAVLNVHGADGCTPLLLASKHGHLELVKFFFAHGASINDRDRDPKRQGNALHYAAWGGHARIVRYLVDEEGASLDDVDIVGNTALLYAVYGGHRTVVDELMRRGRSLQERNSKNHTALLQAACGGHLDLVQWLLTVGFNLNEADHDGNTALLFAAWGGHLDLIHFLLDNGSSLHEQNLNGHSIFLSAANGGRVEIVEWLLQQGFSLTETNNNGDTALLLAAYGGHRHLVERLLELDASLTDRNGCGFTPLLSAANGGQLEMAKWLLENGSSLDECDNDGYTSLILAACGGNIELVQFLIDQGSSLEDRNNNGDSALLLAAYCSHRDLVDWLLQNGSSLQEKNKTGMGVLISAANGGNVETVELLLERIAEFGQDCGDGLESTDEGGYTPLLLAAQRGHLEVVKLLAAYGANLHARTTRHDNDAVALAMDFPEVQQYLQHVWDWTPLQIAADARMVDRVHALVQCGVDVAFHAEGTPTALAISRGTAEYANAKGPSRELELLLQQAMMQWSPNRHALFPVGFKQAVSNLMMLQHMLAKQCTHPILPPEIWLYICQFVQTSWFVSDQDSISRGWKEPSTPTLRLKWRQRKLLRQECVEDAVVTDDEMDAEVEPQTSDCMDEDDDVSEVRRVCNATSVMSAIGSSAAGCPDGHGSPVIFGDGSMMSSSSSSHHGDVIVSAEVIGMMIEELESTAGSMSDGTGSHWSKECELDQQEASYRVAWV